MRIEIPTLKAALAQDRETWSTKAMDAARLAGELENFDPASFGLEGTGYAAASERVHSHAPYARSQQALLEALSSGCSRNLEAVGELEPSEPDGSVDTDHLEEIRSQALAERCHWQDRADDFSGLCSLDTPWRAMCGQVVSLKEREAEECARKIALVQEYVARSASFYSGAAGIIGDSSRLGSLVTLRAGEGPFEDGNQRSLLDLWENAGKDSATRTWISELVRKYHPELDSDGKIRDFLKKLNDEGCGYVADVNALCGQYSNEELRERFSIPESVPNDQINDWLLLDYYASQDNHSPNRFLWFHWGDAYDEHEDKSATDGAGTTNGDRQHRLHRWLEGYGIDAQVSSEHIMRHADVTQMRKDFEAGEHIVLCMYDPIIMHDSDGNTTRMDGGHAVSVKGFDDQGRIIVSSWGKTYYVDPKDYNNQGRISYETVTYDEKR